MRQRRRGSARYGRQRVLDQPERVRPVAAADDDEERVARDGGRRDRDIGGGQPIEHRPQPGRVDLARRQHGCLRPAVGDGSPAEREKAVVVVGSVAPAVRAAVDDADTALHRHADVPLARLVTVEVGREPPERGSDGLSVAVEGQEVGGSGVVDDARAERVEQEGIGADGVAGVGGE